MDLENITKMVGPRWIEIDTEALEHNLMAVKKLITPQTRILAVVKADAYGAGAVESARAFLNAGADYLGVTNLAEGQELRKAGITAPVLIMAPLMPEELLTAISLNLTITVSSRLGAEELAKVKTDKQVRVHLKVETGLQRTGLEPEEVVPVASDMLKLPHVILEGVYSHLAEAARPGATENQFKIFNKVLKELEESNIKLPLRHICNSTGLLSHPEMHLDMVRIGTLLYGQFPYRAPKRGLELKETWRFKARVIFIHDVPAGTPVGYGGDYVTRRDSRLAVIPVGYADGFSLTAVARPKNLNDLARYLVKTVLAYLGRVGGEGTTVTIAGQKVSVVGRVGMQLTMIDITNLSNVEIGQEVDINIRRPTASTRLPRVYCRGRQPYLVRTTSGGLEQVGSNLTVNQEVLY
ncbi:MAG: alanine racemase [Clostridia bacterium]|nr:alanine racemase [Clostridia bacterium]